MLETNRDRGMFRRLVQGLAGQDLSVDLGTSNTLIYQKGKGIVLNEPSIVAYEELSATQRRIFAIGQDAREKLGKTPKHISVARPLREGVVADLDFAEAMLQYFVGKLKSRMPSGRPLILISLPFGVTEVEKHAVRTAGRSVGARAVHLVYEPMAAAIGSGLPVLEPRGQMLIDMGAGTTEVALISLGGIVDCQSVRQGGDRMDQLIQARVRDKYNIAIGDHTAEWLKTTLGTAVPFDDIRYETVKGLDLATNMPKGVTVSSEDVGLAISPCLEAVADAIVEMLSRIEPELASDVLDHGIILTGGCSQLQGLASFFQKRLRIKVSCAKDPLLSVALGGGQALERPELLEAITIY